MTGVPSPPMQSTSFAQPPPGSGASGLSFQSTQDFDRLGNILIGVSAMLFILCTLAVAGRLIARRFAKVSLEADDFVALLAWFLLTALTAEQIVMAHYIRDQSSFAVPDTNSFRSQAQIQLASHFTYTFLITAVRISILLMYRRIFSLKNGWFKIAWWTSMFVVLAYCTALLAVSLAQCSPYSVDNLWLDPMKCRQGPRDTEAGAKAPAIGGFVNALIDICVFLLPVRMVFGLKLTRKRKILVCALFGLGLLGVAVSIARAIALLDIDANPANISIANFCWSTAEAAVALICACLPMQRPLFSHVYERYISSPGAQKTSNL
ncbi:MAG: hypothetical protein Q9216_006136 [Gyalolechia sp. 2 TL-2023]